MPNLAIAKLIISPASDRILNDNRGPKSQGRSRSGWHGRWLQGPRADSWKSDPRAFGDARSHWTCLQVSNPGVTAPCAGGSVPRNSGQSPHLGAGPLWQASVPHPTSRRTGAGSVSGWPSIEAFLQSSHFPDTARRVRRINIEVDRTSICVTVGYWPVLVPSLAVRSSSFRARQGPWRLGAWR